MSYIIIQNGEGIVTHANVDKSNITVPDDAEVFDNIEDFDSRLSDLRE